MKKLILLWYKERIYPQEYLAYVYVETGSKFYRFKKLLVNEDMNGAYRYPEA